MINTLIDLQNLINYSNKTPKLVEIKLNEVGNKYFAILNIDKVEYNIDINTLIDYIKLGNKVANSLVYNNSLYITPSVHNFKNITNNVYIDWTVKEYLGRSKWLCECSCKVKRAVASASLLNGKSTGCGHNSNAFIDLKDKVIGDWTVIEYIGNSMWLCDCACGRKNIKVKAQSLVNGKSKSCGHAYNIFIDLSGKTFGKWTVHNYAGPGTRLWNCTCSCSPDVIHQVDTQSLMDGRSTSCHQCNHTPRKSWQNEALRNKEQFNSILLNASLSINRLLYLQDVAYIFDISERYVTELIDKYDSDCYIIPSDTGISYEEQQLITIIQQLDSNLDIIQKDRRVLNGQELDAYFPSKNFAIEYNGSYWHDSKHKSAIYHQTKTLLCKKSNIDLIHIFDYEWKDKAHRQKLIDLVKTKLNIDISIIYARNTLIRQISTIEANEFCNKYHLQNAAQCNIAYGLYYNEELVEIMTFGTPRFSDNVEAELIRLCTKSGYKIIGGANKLFNHYLKECKPKSVVSYCDLAKFTGKVYEQLGMLNTGITKPGYVYVHTNTFQTLTRLNCMKHKLIEQGLGTEDQTESEIMHNRGYLKVYNCGNVRYVYESKEDAINE